MREIVLDTETTGFDAHDGDRIVEIGAVELWNHMPTGKHYHVYINPERSMPQGAFEVHGLGDEFLADKPLFADVAQGFVDFVGDSLMVIHNAKFDMKFLNAELARVNRPTLPMSQSLDTLAIARQKFPGSPATLDALCRRFGITTERALHGALLDSQILADVYLELIGGRQPDLVLASDTTGDGDNVDTGDGWRPSKRPNPLGSRISEEERAAHSAFIEKMGDDAIWNKLKP